MSWLLALIVLIILGVVIWTFLRSWEDKTTVHLGNAAISAIIADTDKKRTEGLSGRRELARNDGMLFVFPRDGRWGIWMKDMKFGIDIIWLDKMQQVVHITKNVYPDTYPQTFRPDKQARYVLEIPAGTVDDMEISIGQKANFDLPSR